MIRPEAQENRRQAGARRQAVVPLDRTGGDDARLGMRLQEGLQPFRHGLDVLHEELVQAVEQDKGPFRAESGACVRWKPGRHATRNRHLRRGHQGIERVTPTPLDAQIRGVNQEGYMVGQTPHDRIVLGHAPGQVSQSRRLAAAHFSGQQQVGARQERV